MSLDWEKVKGFCRRQTQAVKERMNNAPHTMDANFNSQVEEFVNLRGSAVSTEQKLTQLQNHLNAANQIINDLGTSLAAGHQNEEILCYSRKMEIFRNESNTRMSSLSSVFTSCITELNKFIVEANQLEHLLDDRRDKVLEYDFFKNKLEGLRANPPADTSRIPRNESRMNEWKAKFDDISNRSSSFMQTSRIGGESALLHSAVAVCNEYGRYLDEVARAARAVLFVDPNTAMSAAARQVASLTTAASAMVGSNYQQVQAQAHHVQQQGQYQVQQVQQQVQYQAQQPIYSPNSQVPPASMPPAQQEPPKSNRNKRDDPFAL